MSAEMTKYLSAWDNLNRFVLGDGGGKAMWSTTKPEGLLHEFLLRINRVSHGCLCKKTNLVNTGSLGKCLDSMIQFYPDFPAAGHVLAFPFHLLTVWYLQDVGCTGHQQLPAWGCPKGQVHFWENPALLCHVINMFPLEKFRYSIIGFP